MAGATGAAIHVGGGIHVKVPVDCGQALHVLPQGRQLVELHQMGHGWALAAVDGVFCVVEALQEGVVAGEHERGQGDQVNELHAQLLHLVTVLSQDHGHLAVRLLVLRVVHDHMQHVQGEAGDIALRALLLIHRSPELAEHLGHAVLQLFSGGYTHDAVPHGAGLGVQAVLELPLRQRLGGARGGDVDANQPVRAVDALGVHLQRSLARLLVLLHENGREKVHSKGRGHGEGVQVAGWHTKDALQAHLAGEELLELLIALHQGALTRLLNQIGRAEGQLTVCLPAQTGHAL
mmetsp:Transcript_38904/g.69659  ORF Transcript_38904/g.69659 Transcript_38904/m.69659 type:complete len:291 (+) Transcript_38904:2863-3735(+)